MFKHFDKCHTSWSAPERFLESGSEAVDSVLRLTFTEEQGIQDPVEQSSVKVT